MFLSGKPSYPVERTLLTTGLVAAGVDSLHRDQVRIDTPPPRHRLPGGRGIDFLGAPGSEPGQPAVPAAPDDQPLHADIVSGGRTAAEPPVRVAVIATIYRYLSHGQHFGDRFMIGYAYEGSWHRPDMKVVSMYVDQRPEGDQSEGPGPRVRLHRPPDHRRSAQVRGRAARGRRRRHHRRARRVPRQRARTEAVPALRVLQAVRRGVRGGRKGGAGIQRQAPVVQLRKSERNGRGRTPPRVSRHSGVVASGHLAAAGCRAAPRLRYRGGADGRRRRLRRHGLPRPRGDAVHDREAPGR